LAIANGISASTLDGSSGGKATQPSIGSKDLLMVKQIKIYEK
jgi:hypothetical protein